LLSEDLELSQRIAYVVDARMALEGELQDKPFWLNVHSQIIAHPQYASKSCPRKKLYPNRLPMPDRVNLPYVERQ